MRDLQELSPRNLIIIQYPTNADDNRVASERLSQIDASGHTAYVQYSRHNFTRELRRIVEALEVPSGARILVDLSAMASYVAVRVFTTVFHAAEHAHLHIYYCEAHKYYPTIEEWQPFWEKVRAEESLRKAELYDEENYQSRGIECTYEADVFPGRNRDGLPTTVVAIPNFSRERTETMLTYATTQYNVPRQQYRWLIGEPPDVNKNGWRVSALRELYQLDGEGALVSTLDYRQILLSLESLWEDSYLERHMVIVGLGSKMQHLGLFLFLWRHDDAGLILSEPTKFEAGRYTEGCAQSWIVSLGEIASIRNSLASIGTLSFEWGQ